MAKVAELVAEMSLNTARLQADVGKATRIMSSGMQSMAKSVSFLKNSLLSIASIGSLVALGKSAIDVGGQLSDMSKKFGVSAEELSQLSYVGKMVGVELEDMGNGFKFLSKSISEAQDPTTAQATAFRLLGVNTKNANGTLKSTSEIFDDVADAFSGLEDGANKTALALAIFGKAGSNMLPLFEKGAAGIKEMKAESIALGLSMNDEEIKKLDEYGDAIDRIGMKAKTSAGRLAIFIAEMMTGASGGMEGIAGYTLDTGPAESNVGEDVYAGGKYKAAAKSIAEEEARKKAAEKAAEERKKADEALMKAGEKGWSEYADAILKIDEDLQLSLSNITRQGFEDEQKETEDYQKKDFDGWVAHAEAIVQADYEMAKSLSDITKERFKEEEAANKAIKDFVVNGFNEMADAVANFVTTGQLNFRDFANSVIADLTRMIVKMSMFRILEDVGLGSYMGLSAVPAMALGGPVSAGSSYLVGERGPELFTPSSSGTITPNGAGGVQVNVYNQGGQPMKAKNTQVSTDSAGRTVIGLWLEGYKNNVMDIRTMFGGA